MRTERNDEVRQQVRGASHQVDELQRQEGNQPRRAKLRRRANNKLRRGANKLPRAGALLAGVVVGASLLASCGSGASPYTVRAVFSSAEGLFPGNSVDILGVSKGTVTKVQPEAGYVVVTMSIEGGQPLPARVDAALTNPQLLGEPSVELHPGYSGGPTLAADSVIPESRTSVPVSTDQILRDLQQYLGQVNSQALSGTISNLAQDLQGQGQALNELISQGAGTLNLLAQKGNQLGQLNGSLAQITGTLKQRTSTVTSLLQSYETVGNVIAQQSGPLGDSINELAQMSAQLSALLDPNLQPLQSDIGTITQVGRTLDRNLGSLDQGLNSTVSLFAGAGRAYDAAHNWLNLNVPTEPGLSSSVLEGLVRDRLAGICRRVLANHSAGLSSSQISTLQTCGNPASGYFDPLLSALPNLINGTGSASPGPAPSQSTPQSMMTQGLGQIPGLTPSQVQQLSQVPPSALSGAASTNSNAQGTGSSQLNPSTPQSPPSSSGGGLLGGLLHGITGVAHFLGSLL
jgi:phospholipid/cholesterol/gamma-HCH transport system substrate-binding protein